MAISVSNSVTTSGFRGMSEVNTADGASLMPARSPRYARDDNGAVTARPGLCYGRAIGSFEIASHAFAMTAVLSLQAAGAAVWRWLTQAATFHLHHCAALATGKI